MPLAKFGYAEARRGKPPYQREEVKHRIAAPVDAATERWVARDEPFDIVVKARDSSPGVPAEKIGEEPGHGVLFYRG